MSTIITRTIRNLPLAENGDRTAVIKEPSSQAFAQAAQDAGRNIWAAARTLVRNGICKVGGRDVSDGNAGIAQVNEIDPANTMIMAADIFRLCGTELVCSDSAICRGCLQYKFDFYNKDGIDNRLRWDDFPTVSHESDEPPEIEIRPMPESMARKIYLRFDDESAKEHEARIAHKSKYVLTLQDETDIARISSMTYRRPTTGEMVEAFEKHEKVGDAMRWIQHRTLKEVEHDWTNRDGEPGTMIELQNRFRLSRDKGLGSLDDPYGNEWDRQNNLWGKRIEKRLVCQKCGHEQTERFYNMLFFVSALQLHGEVGR
jgi:hypothetical protein